MRDVYMVWKDYGGGDYSLVSVHSTKEGAKKRVKELFYQAKSDGFSPFWTDDEEKLSFNSDAYEVEVKRVPVLP
jgi:hypothetical protein